MEFYDVAIGLLSIVMVMLGWFFTRLQSTMDRLEHNITNCQTNMPKEYVLKSDYKDDIKEVKSMLGDLFTLVRDKQ
jgi:hypothetical protein